MRILELTACAKSSLDRDETESSKSHSWRSTHLKQLNGFADFCGRELHGVVREKVKEHVLKNLGSYNEEIVSELADILKSAQEELISRYRCENPTLSSSGYEKFVSSDATVSGGNGQIIAQCLVSPNLGSSAENLHTDSNSDIATFERRSLQAQQNLETPSTRDSVEPWPDNWYNNGEYDPTDILDGSNAVTPWWQDLL